MFRIAIRMLAASGCLLAPAQVPADIRTDYELTVAVAETAIEGWRLCQAKEFAGDFDGGKYTDPKADSKTKDFWSNGRYAKVDRDDNGHHETIFLIQDSQLVYIGSIGANGTFVDTSRSHKKYYQQPLAVFVAATRGPGN